MNMDLEDIFEPMPKQPASPNFDLLNSQDVRISPMESSHSHDKRQIGNIRQTFFGPHKTQTKQEEQKDTPKAFLHITPMLIDDIDSKHLSLVQQINTPTIGKQSKLSMKAEILHFQQTDVKRKSKLSQADIFPLKIQDDDKKQIKMALTSKLHNETPVKAQKKKFSQIPLQSQNNNYTPAQTRLNESPALFQIQKQNTDEQGNQDQFSIDKKKSLPQSLPVSPKTTPKRNFQTLKTQIQKSFKIYIPQKRIYHQTLCTPTYVKTSFNDDTSTISNQQLIEQQLEVFQPDSPTESENDDSKIPIQQAVGSPIKAEADFVLPSIKLSHHMKQPLIQVKPKQQHISVLLSDLRFEKTKQHKASRYDPFAQRKEEIKQFYLQAGSQRPQLPFTIDRQESGKYQLA